MRSLEVTHPSLLYSEAEILADFGQIPPSLRLRVAQISTAFGPGTARERTLYV